ncbi:hypothetical protein BX600DRAFT_539187 [Xylariales sp. PMI_506]|nr:hypothetical protein BX600DRAFT_539187 [Xylariales sp. PMI_506]
MTIIQPESMLLPTEIVQTAIDAIENANDELRRLNLEVYNNPEILFQEHKACKLLSDWFSARGWSVQRGVYGIQTAFEARFSVGTSGRTVCFNAEYDALPGIGHACGHNLIATSALASAVGVEAVMKAMGISGTVVVMGTPAEESGGGKWIMAQKGAWKGFDACVMTHGMPDFGTPVCVTKASWKMRAEFHGKTAHAATAPWTGHNACDAIVQAYTGVALLRQQIAKDESIQGVILEAGKAANLIPDFSQGLFSVRSPTVKRLNVLKEKVAHIFNAAAEATGCTVKVDWTALYEDIVTNEALAEQYRQYMIHYLGVQPSDMLPLKEARIKYDQPGSSDFGSCSYICPGIQAMFPIAASDLPHSKGFLEASKTDVAHAEALRAGKANALICLDVLINDDFAKGMKAEFKQAMQEAGRWDGD